MMQTEFIPQFAHFWRVFERLAAGFDETGWLQGGRNANTPARLSFHILKATRYYLEDASPIQLPSGRDFEINGAIAENEALPTQTDVIACIHLLANKTETWLKTMDYAAENTAFPWAGKTRLGVALFLLKHSTWHLGELSQLLNDHRDGNVEDHYVNAL